MAASALLQVEYVDGAGAVRIAADDAPEQMDRDASWAFRGGGEVGIATRLKPVPQAKRAALEAGATRPQQ